MKAPTLKIGRFGSFGAALYANIWVKPEPKEGVASIKRIDPDGTEHYAAPSSSGGGTYWANIAPGNYTVEVKWLDGTEGSWSGNVEKGQEELVISASVPFMERTSTFVGALIALPMAVIGLMLAFKSKKAKR